MLISERVKVDAGLVPQALNNTNITGRYYSMAKNRRALFVLQGGAMAATKTSKLEVFEATDGSGTSGALLAGATATATANALVNKVTLTLVSSIAGDYTVINGITFTGKTGAAVVADREYSVDTSDTAAAASLVLMINDATYGVPGVLASSAAGVVTLVMFKDSDPEPSDENSYTEMTAITATTPDSTITIATLEVIVLVEVDASAMTAGYTHLAAKVTTTANTIVSVDLLRSDPRITPDQEVGASARV